MASPAIRPTRRWSSTTRPPPRDVALLTLSHPHYDRGRETLTYRAAPLHGKDAALASFARRGDPIQPGRIGSTSLFIDDGGGAAYTQITLSVSNVEPGHTISIHATPDGSGRDAWSLGRPGSAWSDLQFDAGPSPIPVSSFSVGGSWFTMITSASAGGLNGFHASLSLEYEETQAIYLTVVNDPALEITASFPTASGLQTVPLGPSPMLLSGMVGL